MEASHKTHRPHIKDEEKKKSLECHAIGFKPLITAPGNNCSQHIELPQSYGQYTCLDDFKTVFSYFRIIFIQKCT